MLQDDRENLELERLQNETRKLIVERRKLMAEENKLKRERFWYPVAVGTGLLTAITAVFGLLTKLQMKRFRHIACASVSMLNNGLHNRLVS